jgi:hypothetical protein
MEAIGSKVWAIPEGCLPSGGIKGDPALEPHEATCILNTGDSDADVVLTLYFTDREPTGPYRLTVGARRTVHVRINDLSDPEPVPRDTPYASLIISTQPVVVQYTRLDSRDARIALLSTLAFPRD